MKTLLGKSRGSSRLVMRDGHHRRWTLVGVKPRLLCAVSLVLGGCDAQFEAIQPSAQGYEAIRFTRTIEVRETLFTNRTFEAGSVYVADRRTPWGIVYCGPSSGSLSSGKCIGIESTSTIVLEPGSRFFETRMPLEEGSFQRLVVRQ